MQGLLILFTFATVALVHADRDWSKRTPFSLKDVAPGNSRIIGGDEAKPHSFPHQVGLNIRVAQGIKLCGGSILSSKFILTAAHCVDKSYEIEVIVGAHNIDENEPTQQRIVTTKYHIHDSWTPLIVRGDIAIIELPEEIHFNENVQPIRLPSYSDADAVLTGKAVTVSGWGKTSNEDSSASSVLRYVNDEIISPLRCRLAFIFITGKNNICTSGFRNIGACSGDSGGPLIGKEADGKNTQLGIVSFGLKLSCTWGWPSVFTRVSSYLSWIHKITNLPIRA